MKKIAILTKHTQCEDATERSLLGEIFSTSGVHLPAANDEVAVVSSLPKQIAVTRCEVAILISYLAAELHSILFGKD